MASIGFSLLVFSANAGACSQSFPEWRRGKNFSAETIMDGQPIPHMHVLLLPVENEEDNKVETITDGYGFARFLNVKTGRYYILATRLGVRVGPGEVVVSDKGSSKPIQIEWPFRDSFTVSTIAGRFQRRLYPKSNPIDGFIHPRIGPVAEARLTVSRIDSELEVKTVKMDSDGNFDFGSLEAGAYLLRFEEKKPAESTYSIDDAIVVYVDLSSERGTLNLQFDWTSCGINVTEIP